MGIYRMATWRGHSRMKSDPPRGESFFNFLEHLRRSRGIHLERRCDLRSCTKAWKSYHNRSTPINNVFANF